MVTILRVHAFCCAILFLGLLLMGAPLRAAQASDPMERNYDARRSFDGAVEEGPSGVQFSAFESLLRDTEGAAVSWDRRTGVARTLVHRTGYLTPPATRAPETEADALDIALAYVQDRLPLLGLTSRDLEDFEVTDAVFSRVSGAWHLYLRQTHAGLSVYNAQLHINVNRDGRILSVNNSFLPGLAFAVHRSAPRITAPQAVAQALEHLAPGSGHAPRVLGPARGTDRRTALDADGISLEPIEAHLMWLPIGREDARLVWNFQIATLDSQHWFDFTVDAADGKVWTRFDWVDDAGYTVYPQPVESPNHTTPLPPADARVLVTDPQDATASPFGWHDTDGTAGPEFTIHRGNNAHAYDDRNTSNGPPAVEPDCGAALDCTFPIDLTMAPSTYTSAAVTELFYWNNIIHDVQYHYGFDEAGGNFQVNNYGNGGVGGDDVQAEAQDGSGTNNATFGTPPDGQRPRMQMFEFTITSPRRDGDFDHGIIAHEYGHGITNRMVGGPANAGCLGNLQQPGEGWSDWFGLVYTATATQVGTDIRGSGTYVLGQSVDGPGVRPQPYTTDPVANTYTYESIAGLSIPHGLGSVWAQAAWEMYWALVDQHGFDANLYDAMGGSGNQRALLYVTEGLKNIPCEPTFLDVRDGILQAAVDTMAGEDVCLLWGAFAAFGLGEDATTVGRNSTTVTNGFAVPAACDLATIFVDGFESGDTGAWSSQAP